MIRLTVPSLDESDFAAVTQVLESGFLVQGPQVAAFERTIAQRIGIEYAVAVSSCTAALHLSLLALGIGRDDIVVTSAYSFPATANVIELCGAKPVFIDICHNTFNLDPRQLDTVLHSLMNSPRTARRVKAVLPVHAFGQLADMRAILEIAGQYGLPVVEDAACALGASLNGKQAGTWGKLGCFSFHPRKAITTGEGGVITTSDANLADLLKTLRNHGLDPNSSVPEFVLPGYNYRLTEFQGALGLVQAGKLDRVVAARRQLAAQYQQLLAESPLECPHVPAGHEPVFQSFVTLLPSELAIDRSALIAELKELGIEATIGTWHVPLTKYFRLKYGFHQGDFPVTDEVFHRALTLPLWEHLSFKQQERVAAAISRLVRPERIAVSSL